MKSGIYKIINTINNKFYIGSSKDLNKRKHRHFGNLKTNKHENQYLQNDWNKCGEINFIFEIIEYVDEEKLLVVEQKYLDLYWDNKNICYNICNIVGPGPTMFGKNNPFYGKKHSQKTLKIIGEKSKLKKYSNEYKQKISFAISGENNPNFGKKHSLQTIEKMKLAAKNRWSKAEERKKISDAVKQVWKNNEYGKKVLQFSVDGKLIEIFDSLATASEKTKIPTYSIMNCIKKRNKTSFGFVWRFENE